MESPAGPVNPSRSFPLNADKVVPYLYVSGAAAARDWDGPTVSVHESHPESTWAHWVPILEQEDWTHQRGRENSRASKRMLDAAAEIVHHYRERDQTVLVHCGAGIERSPLTCAWYLRKYQLADSINEAYDLIESVRPQIQRRTHWLDFNG